MASYAEAGSPLNKVAGLGFGGVQTALLSTRLADAAAAGCDIAVITTRPASRSQHNAQRNGFDLLYARAILVKEP